MTEQERRQQERRQQERRQVVLETLLAGLNKNDPGGDWLTATQVALLQAALGERDGFESTMECRNGRFVALKPVLELVGQILLEAAAGGPPGAPQAASTVARVLGKGGAADAEELSSHLLGRIKESHPDTFESPNLSVGELRARAIALANQHVALLQALRASL